MVANQLLPATGCLCGHGALEGFCWMEARDDEHWASAYFQWHNHLDRVNLFNFTGNLYGQELLVSFISKIRDEHKFDSLEAGTTAEARQRANQSIV